MKKFLPIILSLISATALFCGCGLSGNTGSGSGGGGEGEVTGKGYTYFAMSTTADVAVFDDFSNEENKVKFENFKSEVGTLLVDIENSISATRTASAIYKFNAAAAGATVPLDEISYNVLSVAKSVYELTDGYYNPAVYYNVQAYGFNSSSQYPKSEDDLPSDEVIEAYMDLYSHFDELIIGNGEDGYYAVKPNYTVEVDGKTLSLKLDLGGIGKGYAVDCVNGLMASYGYTKGYFNFGSSSIAIKKFKDGTPYNLGFTNPRAIWDTYASMPIGDECLSTSGDYENCFALGGKRYCHIFSPKTGRPIDTGIMTATIIGGSAAENDALTTAIMAMGADAAIKFIEEELSALGKKVIFTLDDGTEVYKYYTNMADGSYELLADFSKLETA